MIKFRFLAVLGALALMLSFPAVASAQIPPPPHVFVGTAWQDGVVAPRGTLVSAWVDGEEKGFTTVGPNGRYFPLFVEPGTSDLIIFSVGGNMADQVATWEKGGADILDLTANSNFPAPGMIPPPAP